jgi:hypothetical protein
MYAPPPPQPSISTPCRAHLDIFNTPLCSRLSTPPFHFGSPLLRFLSKATTNKRQISPVLTMRASCLLSSVNLIDTCAVIVLSSLIFSLGHWLVRHCCVMLIDLFFISTPFVVGVSLLFAASPLPRKSLFLASAPRKNVGNVAAAL